VKYKEVLEKVCEPGRLLAAWRQIRRNAGAAGIDQMTVGEFERREDELLQLIQKKLKVETYSFKPARRALIPKEGTSKHPILPTPSCTMTCTNSTKQRKTQERLAKP
jgi:hypothetical protein